MNKYTYRFNIPQGSKMLGGSEFGRNIDLRINAENKTQADAKAQAMADRMTGMLSSGHVVTVSEVSNGS